MESLKIAVSVLALGVASSVGAAEEGAAVGGGVGGEAAVLFHRDGEQRAVGLAVLEGAAHGHGGPGGQGECGAGTEEESFDHRGSVFVQFGGVCGGVQQGSTVMRASLTLTTRTGVAGSI